MTIFVSIKEAENMRSDINVEGLVQKGVVKTVTTYKGKTLVCNSYLLDETNMIKFVLWGSDIKKVKDGDIISIRGANTTTFRNEVQLNLPGKNGELEVIIDDDAKKRWHDNHSKDESGPCVDRTDYLAIEKENEKTRQKFRELRERIKDKKDEEGDGIDIIEEEEEIETTGKYADLSNPFTRPAEHMPDIKYDTKQESENTDKSRIIKKRECPKCKGLGYNVLDSDTNIDTSNYDFEEGAVPTTPYARSVKCTVCNGEGRVIVKEEEAKDIDISKLKFVTVSEARKIKTGINIVGYITIKDDSKRLSEKLMGKWHDYLMGELTDEEGETIPVSFHGTKEFRNIRNGTEVRIIGGLISDKGRLIIRGSGKIEIISG